mmetsp:Transcript_31091/g.92362  ORF Transcript_31091/g.92362 Transcript_31091/m.92362 type:complete len:245 (-) Transcript_31091:331-1065(-)
MVLSPACQGDGADPRIRRTAAAAPAAELLPVHRVWRGGGGRRLGRRGEPRAARSLGQGARSCAPVRVAARDRHRPPRLLSVRDVRLDQRGAGRRGATTAAARLQAALQARARPPPPQLLLEQRPLLCPRAPPARPRARAAAAASTSSSAAAAPRPVVAPASASALAAPAPKTPLAAAAPLRPPARASAAVVEPRRRDAAPVCAPLQPGRAGAQLLGLAGGRRGPPRGFACRVCPRHRLGRQQGG